MQLSLTYSAFHGRNAIVEHFGSPLVISPHLIEVAFFSMAETNIRNVKSRIIENVQVTL